MKINKAYKFRLCPNKEQAQLIDKTIGCTRFVYNCMLSDKIKHWEETKTVLKNTPAQYKEQYPFLKEVDSLSLANAQLNLDKAYSNFFRKLQQGNKKAGFPKFKSKKKCKLSYTTNNQKGSIRLEGKTIKLPKIGFVKLKQHRIISDDKIIKSVTIIKTNTNKYFISILLEYETQIQKKSIDELVQNAVGLDFSMKGLYVDSENAGTDFPRFYRKAQEKLAKEQRILSRRKYNSIRYNKQRVKVAKVHERVSNQRKDFLHKQSLHLVNKYNLICIEDLNMQNMSQCLKLGKSVYDNGWGLFTSILQYKLEERGKVLHKIDKWFPSSKMCNVCEVVNRNLQLSDREWDCSCGVHHFRDYNAAINIRNSGIKRTVGITGLAQ